MPKILSRCFLAAPRYTATCAPFETTAAAAALIARVELEAYREAVSGKWGLAALERALELGVNGIVTMTAETSEGEVRVDALTRDAILKPSIRQSRIGVA